MAEELFGGKEFNKAISELEKAFEDKSAFQKFIDTVKDILSRIKEALGGSASVDALERNIVKLQKQIESGKTVKKTENKAINSVDNKESRYERTDEFRKLQAESKRMSEKDIQLYHSGNRQIDERIRGRLSRSVQEIFLGTDDNGVSNAKGLLSLSAKNNTFEIYQDVNAELFRDVFEIARNYLKFGELVDLHEVNTTDESIGYKDCLNYLSKDGLSGFSITPDGDLISVFNASGKSGFLRAIAPVVKEKAKTLDCYASKEQNLQSMYTAIFNFKTASVMDYNMEYDHDNIAENHGKPQVAFMVNTESKVETKHFTKDQYDEAVEYRNSFVEKDIRVSKELKDIISRLNNNEAVSIEEINANEQIKKARAKADSIPATNTINTAERKKLRQSITDKLLENGSYTGVDENGKEVYNGNIKTERRIDLVIGVPAAGKSSVLVNPLSEQYNSRVIDSDMAKELLPEFNNGLGANAVHKESQNIIDDVLYKALVNGENIVHPIVGGGKLESLVDKISYFKEKGYSVYLHLNELPINKSVGRAINRFIETGRFIPPEILFDYQDKPTQNFNQLKEREDLIDGYSHYSNDVRKGESPKLIEASEGVQLLFGRGQRRSERTKSSRTEIQSKSKAGLENSAFSNSDKKYSYNELTSKPDMEIVSITEDFAKNGNAVDRKGILQQAKKTNCVYVKDLGENVNITRKGILHFTEKTIKLSSNAISDTAKITPDIAEIIKNSVVVNELRVRENKNRDIKKSFVLIGLATDTNNDYLVRTIVDKYTNDVLECDFYNLYATKAKKEEMLGRSPSAVGQTSSNTVPSLSISISDLLKNVKDVKLVNSVLSKDVLDNLGIERPDSVFKDSLKYSADDDLKELNEKYGTIKKGVNAERDIDVPKQTSEEKVTSFTVRSILEKGNIDGLTLGWIKESVIDEAQSHKIYSDEKALEYAQRHLKNGDALQIWQDAVSGKATKNDIAIGSALLEMYANSTELSEIDKADKILNITAELCEVGTRLGQAVQAFSLLKKMGGVGRLYYLQKSVDTLNKDLEKKYKGKKQVKIGDAEAELLANAKSEQEVTEAAIKENRILFVDKKSSQQLNYGKRVQYPNGVSTISYNKSLTQYKALVNSYYTKKITTNLANPSRLLYAYRFASKWLYRQYSIHK